MRNSLELEACPDVLFMGAVTKVQMKIRSVIDVGTNLLIRYYILPMTLVIDDLQ